jgi:hypothetical protein
MAVRSRLGLLAKELSDRSDGEIREEVTTLRDELRSLRYEHRLFRDRAHAAADRTIADARTLADRYLAELVPLQHPLEVDRFGFDGPHFRAAALIAMSRPEFAQAWHEAIDSADIYSPLTSAEVEAKAADLERLIREREAELDRREIAARKKEAEQDLRDLEARL